MDKDTGLLSSLDEDGQWRQINGDRSIMKLSPRLFSVNGRCRLTLSLFLHTMKPLKMLPPIVLLGYSQKQALVFPFA
ncbi:MAG: hypothetical protein ACMZI0_17305 [Symbiopectobacterium sp.]|uniref:hypothetical protein n=1 Tax=Symbiopectobacterium sp. TaxID=2952789 RepID=UPI0039EA6445